MTEDFQLRFKSKTNVLCIQRFHFSVPLLQEFRLKLSLTPLEKMAAFSSIKLCVMLC